MNDIRRTILWVVFGFSLVMLWDQWQISQGKKPTFFPQPTPTAATPPQATVETPPNTATPAPASQLPQTAGSPTTTDTSAKRIEVETDVLKLQFSTEGGSLVRAELSKHKDAHRSGSNVVLMDNSQERVYLAQSGLIGAPNGAQWPTHKTPMVFSGQTALKDGENELQITFESAPSSDIKLVKTYLLKRGSYAIEVKHDIVNMSSAAVSPQLYVQLVRDGNKPEGESAFYSTFTGPAVYTTAKKYQKIEFADIEKGKADFEKQSQQGYVAMVQHYFASAWLLDDTQQRELFARKIDTNLYSVGMVAPLPAIAPASRLSQTARLFVGPQEEKALEAIYPGLELVKDYGWLTILSKPLYWLLYELNRVIGNWGWAIVALVVVLKMAFYWLNSQAYKSMGKMKAINPKIMEMRERLKDNPQQMQMEMMRIYREEKVNPLGGCLPIAVQIPFFIALYWVLLSSVEMRNAPWVGWVHDLAAPDPWFILPLLMTATSMFQTWLNPTPPDPIQAKMMWFMPLAFSVMFFFFPAGLVLYWLSNNILSIAQQWMINKQLGITH
ncbi:MAG: membrane protein insertase YidC [Betaproteobacteria bacterium]|jgi:YidC/Oxa1 family membrane protein insertase|nr:membrane protein insertase YidC [Betaproteobacteria bacterium]